MSEHRITRIAGYVGDDLFGVTRVTGRSGGRTRAMLSPCAQCPWRVDRVGNFPAEAFRISAPTCYDAAFATFACHMSGRDRPAICAGFLIRHAEHNVGVRIARMNGLDLTKLTDGGLELHADYVEMAVANGVDPDDPVLRQVRKG